MVLCRACGQTYPAVPEAEPVDKTDEADDFKQLQQLDTRSARRSPFQSTKVLAFVGVPVALLLIIVIVRSTKDLAATIHVDNGTEEHVQVFLDGKLVAQVGPNFTGLVHSSTGTHRVQVRRHGEIVFDETKDLAPASSGRCEYLLNVEGRNQYVTYEVEYVAQHEKKSKRKSGGQARPFHAGVWCSVNQFHFVLLHPPETLFGEPGTRRVLERVRFEQSR